MFTLKPLCSKARFFYLDQARKIRNTDFTENVLKCFINLPRHVFSFDCLGRKLFGDTAKMSRNGVITVDAECLLDMKTSPCASLLYRWFLRERPVEEEVEFEIEDFNQYMARVRPRGRFCEASVKNALKQLEELGIIKIVKKYNARTFKLIVFEADIKDGQIVRAKNSAKKRKAKDK